MTETDWQDRRRRAGMMIRAPINFLTAQTYRQAIFQGMRRGEAFIRAGLRRIRRASPSADYPLPLVMTHGPPAVCVFVPSIAFDGEQSEDGRLACALLPELVAAGAPIRLIAVETPPGPHERRVRRWLQDQGVTPAAAQARLEIVDGSGLYIPIGAGDVLVTAGRYEDQLRRRLAERGLDAPVHRLEAGAQLERPAIADPWPRRSRLGLGYRVLKSLASDHAPGRTCLFVHFDPGGRIDPCVLRYIGALKACGLDVVLISSCDLDAAAFAPAEPLLCAAICRQNKGLDFSGWALALELFPELACSERLIIANDSVYGPIGELEPFLERMEGEPYDVWGAVESRDIDRHFQSWFVCFRRPALLSPAFAAFWSSVLPMDDKSEIIRQYEVPILRTFEAAGLRVGAAVTAAAHRHTTSNPTMDDWRTVLEHGAPFIKVQLLRDNPLETSLDGWTAELSRRGYPVWLVLDHLYRVRGAEAAGFKTS